MSTTLVPTTELRRLTPEQAKKLPLGSRIRWARARAGLSHDALALEINSSRSYLIRVEKGIHVPSTPYRLRVARATAQPPEFLDAG